MQGKEDNQRRWGQDEGGYEWQARKAGIPRGVCEEAVTRA